MLKLCSRLTMYHMSHVTCHVSRHIFKTFFFLEREVKLADGDSVINGAYPVYFKKHWIILYFFGLNVYLLDCFQYFVVSVL